jgi:hypothetical protein
MEKGNKADDIKTSVFYFRYDNMASGNDQTIHEIFADNDNGNDDEFEGFDPEDIDLNNENGRTDLCELTEQFSL